MSVSVLARYQAVHTYASQSGGFITTEELRQLGVPQSTVARWFASGLLVRVRRGIYRTDNLSYGFEDTLHLASKVMTPQQAIGARTALELWGLPGGSRGVPHLVGPKGCRPVSASMRNSEYRDIRTYDLTIRSGFRVTTALRSIIDSSRWCDSIVIGEQLSAAVKRKLFTYDELAMRVVEISRPGKRGLHKLRRVLAARLGDDRPLNSYELSARRVFRTAGFPPPIVQMRLTAGQRVYFVDFAWPEHHLIVECDSMLAHSTPEQLQNDLTRQNDIVALGWTIVRFTYWDVIDDPEKVVATLSHHLPRHPQAD